VNAPDASAGTPGSGAGHDSPDRARLGQLAEEQAALRRVATLVARGVVPDELFAAVTGEVGRLLGAHLAGMGRYDSDDSVTMLATWGAEGEEHPLVPGPWPLEGGDLASIVFRTGQSVRIDDYHSVPGPIAAFVREELGVGASVASPVVVEGRLWGVLFLHAKQTRRPFPRDAESRLRDFTELVATAVANADTRAALARLAEEQAALRRVATLVAHATPPEQVLAAVAEEVGRLLAVDYTVLIRSDPQDMITVVGGWTATGVGLPSPVGSRFEVGGRNVSTLTLRAGRPARLDAYVDVTGSIGNTGAQGWGFRSSVGVPISVEGRLWGLILVAYTRDQQLPADTETQLASFTELVATAIANTESRASVARLAQEQAALRRVATLVARGMPPAEVFSAVSDEVARLFGAQAGVLRFSRDDLAAFFVGVSKTFELPVSERWEFQPGMASAEVHRTGGSARIDAMDWSSASGPAAAAARHLGVVSSVASPIVVEGGLWGAIIVASTDEPLPVRTEERLENFTELLATAIANAESRSELAASRRRIVAASDEARRRIERDLHDGTQQRLVSLGLAARMAGTGVAADRADLRAELSRIAAGLADAVAELQELSRGIHPAILSERGLGSALRTLARRSAIPVDLDVTTKARYPEPVEIAAYYVASEALANAMKHAQASRVEISLTTHSGSLLLSIRDDGIGGADPARGSGLAGLTDRVEALGGSIRVHSTAGAGTHITVDLPFEYKLAQGAG
jgi:signal transduction histidine kinase